MNAGNAPTNITVRVNGTRTYCYGGTAPETFDITINSGTTTKSLDIITTGYVECGGQDPFCVTEIISIDSYEILTSPYTICD